MTAGGAAEPAGEPATDPRPRCYIASPLGFTEAGRHWYADIYLPALATVVEPVDPWGLTSEIELARAIRAGNEADLYREIGVRNSAALRSCTVLVALLDGQELDSGTAAELGYGAALGLRCFGLRTDLRQIGEAGSPVNLQIQAFVAESGGAIVTSLEELVTLLRVAAG